MKILTNENNPNTLKLLIALKLALKKVAIVRCELGESPLHTPRVLPVLQLDEETSFFSTNAAVFYLYPNFDPKYTKVVLQQLEWESNQLFPTVMTLLASKSPVVDVKEILIGLLQDLNKKLEKAAFVQGNLLQASDVAIWCSLFLVYSSDTYKSCFDGLVHLTNWFVKLSKEKAFKEAVIEWGGSPKGPFPLISAVGIQPVGSKITPSSSPDDQKEEGITVEEVILSKQTWDHGADILPPPITKEKVILPDKKRHNVLITSSLPYVNNIPHLGNIIGCVLSADIFARYCRTCEYNTLFICGTDEYGTATETKALQENTTPQKICDKYYTIHKACYDWFNISFDHFGRTSTQHQTIIAHEMFLKLMRNGFVFKEGMDQLFCPKCKRFLADRFVEGICPHVGCGYEDARGDQCDKCGKLINAIELIKPKCKLCSTKPVLMRSDQFFIDLPKLEPVLRSWIARTDEGWSGSARAVTRSWLKDGLKPRCITRDLKWGVSVPIEEYMDKVFYVWFDAPIGYHSITKAYTEMYREWWRPDADMYEKIQLYNFMAKDNVPFHSILFPATLMGLNEGYKLVNHIYATEYLNYEEGKFSKSRGVGVFGTDAKDTGIPADVWRYYLACIRPEGQDSSFSWVELGTRNNSELLNNLGNFCHRSLSFVASTFKGILPPLHLMGNDYYALAFANREAVAYVKDMERGRLREALKRVMNISRLGNQYMQSNQPWVLIKSTNEEERNRGSSVINFCVQLVAWICTFIQPYMPETSEKLLKQLQLPLLRINPKNPRLYPLLGAGHKIGKPEPLFVKLDMDRLMELKKKYAGTQEQRANGQNGGNVNIQELEAAIAKQGDKVRQLKSSTKDKSVWQPEVNVLLELKKKLELAQKSAQASSSSGGSAPKTAAELEKAIAEQGDKVRQLKASTKDKSVWQPEVNILLQLKQELSKLKV